MLLRFFFFFFFTKYVLEIVLAQLGKLKPCSEASMYHAVITQSLICMQIHTSRCLSSVYQLMRPVNSDMTLQSGDKHKSRKEEETQSLFILLRAHANQPLVPFQRRNMKISISAMRYELVCFCLPHLWVWIMLEHHKWIR